MRKIEKQMNFALSNKGNWGGGNTSVFFYPDENFSEVRLHGNLIAWYDHTKQTLGISSCGWETVTTKSRLNALLHECFYGYTIYQRNYQWYVTDNGHHGMPVGDHVFYDGLLFSKEGVSNILSHPNVA